jgi:hypothetical protein
MLRPHIEGARSLRGVASEASIPYRTAVRWARGYRKHGLVALARKSQSDQGERRLASTQLIEAIEGLALERPPLPISSIHRQASAMAEILQERKPSYAVVHRIVRNLPTGLLMLAHRGNKAYSEGFDSKRARYGAHRHARNRKRIARYPQFFSRIGFVHEFRAPSDADIQALLDQRWTPVGIHLPVSSGKSARGSAGFSKIEKSIMTCSWPSERCSCQSCSKRGGISESTHLVRPTFAWQRRHSKIIRWRNDLPGTR